MLNLSRPLLFTLTDFQDVVMPQNGSKYPVVGTKLAKEDLLASGEMMDRVKNLFPGVLRYERSESRLMTMCSLRGSRMVAVRVSVGSCSHRIG